MGNETQNTMTFAERMKLALALYQSGQPVVLKDKLGNVIHGQDNLETFGPDKCRIIDGIDVDEWKISDWPQRLEGARRGWLKNKTLK